jgi:TPR repeat protein
VDIAELHKRAEQGNVVAQSLLGLCYLSGEHVKVDYARALHYLSLAASEGAPRAMLNLGRMYAQGLGVSQNAAKAIHFFERVTTRPDQFFAQIELARVFADGLGVPTDWKAALEWYSKAIANGEDLGNCEELAEAKAYVASKA